MKLSLVLSSLLFACSSTPAVTVGTTQAGPYTFDVLREGDAPAAGVTTMMVLKATAGGMPTSITGWIGVASGEGSTKALAVYDAADGDYDDEVTAPTPLPAGAKYYFEVTTDDRKVTGSIDLK